MKSLGFVLAMVAMVPVFALIPACAAEVGEESEALLEAEAVEAPDLELESNVPGGGCTFCTKKSFVGAGSCTISSVCSVVYDCGGGMKKYKCLGLNYEHWKNCGSSDIYIKQAGSYEYTTNCQSWAPSANCPGFCN